jgi:hypothetical protein
LAGTAEAAGTGGAEESPSGIAAARCTAGKFISNKTASTKALRMFAPRKSELSIRETSALLSDSNGWPRVTRPKVQVKLGIQQQRFGRE